MVLHPSRRIAAAARGALHPRRHARLAHRRTPAERDARDRNPAAGHRRHAARRSARLAERTGNMDVKPHDEHIQRLYARWLDAATKTGFAASLCAFLLYVFGALPPYVDRRAHV